MCLAIPARVKQVDREEGTARVDLEGVEMETRIDLVPQVEPGAWVILHAGYAISTLDEEEARETIRLLQQVDGPE
jgi:hydrogenase expression/formation protein HypC